MAKTNNAPKLEDNVEILEVTEEGVVDQKLVNEVCLELQSKFLKHANSYIEDVAKYLIEKFYGGDPQRVIDKNPVYGKSLLALYEKLEDSDSQLPKKSWLYAAMSVYADGKRIEATNKRVFQTYGKLLPSQKVELTRLKDESEFQKKIALLKEDGIEKVSVRDLRKKVSELKGNTPTVTKIKFDKKISVISSQVEKWQEQIDTALKQNSKQKEEFRELKKLLNTVMGKIKKLQGA